MYRSASTLQFQIVSQLVKETRIGQQVGWIDAQRFSEVRNSYQSCQQLKVVKVHQFTDAIGEEFNQNNAIGIYTFRDIRDVYVSMMQQQQKSFDAIWNWHGQDFIQTCLNNYKQWTSLPRVLVSRYENICQNIAEEVQRIAMHLGIDIDADKYQNIASLFTLEKQQNRIKKFREQLMQTPLNPDDHRALVDYHDEGSLLHINHITSAKTGIWQKHLAPNEIAKIETKVKDWCRNNMYDYIMFLQSI
ncbi:sulfotransferase domain-containing protein [Chroococcidiopsis sp. TS-821]|uniref:sulfotransferase domain-containing protein n=1 Tax=Chroococcidiopsis sp. TS-821 TaxID=1378066 RepID=UPI001AEF590A|nr:sulfotransferase domain-containing protein [Chroococcidiopsis sp. TS-821]